MKSKRTAVNLLDDSGRLSAISETLYNCNKETTNNEKCFAKSGYFAIDNKNAMNLKKINHPDRCLLYIDGMYRSTDNSGKDFFYCVYKVLSQTIPVEGVDEWIASKDRLTDVLVPVYDQNKKLFCGTESSKALIKLLGDEDCTFWDWGYADTYPSKNSPREITSGFSGTAYSDVVRNFNKSCYDLNEKSQIYLVVLPVSDRKDKHNTWKNSYSARIDLESVDATYLRDLNGGEMYNPSDLTSSNMTVRNRARDVLLKATKTINLICDEALKSNVLQGIRLAEDVAIESGASLTRNPFKANKKSLMSFKNYSVSRQDFDSGDSDEEVDIVPVPKKKKKVNKKKEDSAAEINEV